MKKNKPDFIEVLVKESSSYQAIDKLEGLVQDKNGKEVLQKFPVQPLYLILKSRPTEETSSFLPLLSHEQREVLLNLDLWSKDLLEVKKFEYWVEAYSKCADDDIRREFAKSSEFSLFLKGRFNIWTFDVEDPQYPDHDNYFLTDDNLLLFEYDEDYPYVEEVQLFIRELYAEMGVEKAYSYLFKIVSTSFMHFQEDEYQIKKGKLDDYGFVDYYDALEYTSVFQNIGLIDHFINTKKSSTGNIDEVGKLQALHQNSVIPYQKGMDNIREELSKINDSKRLDYLQFNFMRLVNGTLALDNSLQEGAVAMTRSGEKNKAMLNLGFEYVQNLREDVLLNFDFKELYKIGFSLVQINLKKIKKALIEYKLEEYESFLGQEFQSFLDDSFENIPKLRSDSKVDLVNNLNNYKIWTMRVDFLVNVLPFISSFHRTYLSLIESNKIMDSFYLNYDVVEIDFEAMILSSFCHFILGNFDNESSNKMGITIDELREFIDLMGNKETYEISDIEESIVKFVNKFGMDEIEHITDYIFNIFKGHLEGYEFDGLRFEDYKHIGGPLILASLKH